MKKILFSTLFIISFFVITTSSFLIAENNDIPEKPLKTLTQHENIANKNYEYAKKLLKKGNFTKCIKFCDAAIKGYRTAQNAYNESADVSDKKPKNLAELNKRIDKQIESAEKTKQTAENKLLLIKDGTEAFEAAKAAKEEGKWNEVQTKSQEAITKLEALQTTDPIYKNIATVITPLGEAKTLKKEADSYLKGEKEFEKGERLLAEATRAKTKREWETFKTKIDEAVTVFTNLSSTSANMFYRRNRDKVLAKKEEAEKLQTKAKTYYESETYFQKGQTALEEAQKAREEDPPNWGECLNKAKEAVAIFEEIKKPDSEHKLFYDTEWWAVGGILENKVTLGIKKANKLIAEAQPIEEEAEELFEQAKEAVTLAETAKTNSAWNECEKQADKALRLIEKLKKDFAKTNTYEDNEIEINLTLSAEAENLQKDAKKQIGDVAKYAGPIFDEGKKDLEKAEDAREAAEWETCLSKAQDAISKFTQVKNDYPVFYNSKEMNIIQTVVKNIRIPVNQVDLNLKRAEELKTKAEKFSSAPKLNDGIEALQKAKDAENVDSTIVHSSAQEAIDIFNDIINNHAALYEDSKESIDNYLKEAKDLKIKVSTKYFEQGIKDLSDANNDKKQGKWQKCLDNATLAETIFTDIKTNSKHKEFYDTQKIAGSKWYEKLGDWAQKQLVAISDYTSIQLGDGKTIDEALNVAEDLITEATMHTSNAYEQSETLYRDGQTIMSELKELKANAKSAKDWENIQTKAEEAITIFGDLKKEEHKEFYDTQKPEGYWETAKSWAYWLAGSGAQSIDEYLEEAKAYEKEAILKQTDLQPPEETLAFGIEALNAAQKSKKAGYWEDCLSDANTAINIFTDLKNNYEEFYNAQKATSTWESIKQKVISQISYWSSSGLAYKTLDEYLTDAESLKKDAKIHLSDGYKELETFWEGTKTALEEAQKAQTAENWGFALEKSNLVLENLNKIKEQDTDAKKVFYNEHTGILIDDILTMSTKAKKIKEKAEKELQQKSAGNLLQEGLKAIDKINKLKTVDPIDWAQIKDQLEIAKNAFDAISKYEGHQTFYNNNQEKIDNYLKYIKTLEEEIRGHESAAVSYQDSEKLFNKGKKALEEAQEAKDKKAWATSAAKVSEAINIFNEIKTTLPKHSAFYSKNESAVDDELSKAEKLQEEIKKLAPKDYLEAASMYEEAKKLLKQAETVKNKESLEKVQKAIELLEEIRTNPNYIEFYEKAQKAEGAGYTTKAKKLEQEIIEHLNQPQYKKSETYFEKGIASLNAAQESKKAKDWTSCLADATAAKKVFENIETDETHKFFYESQNYKGWTPTLGADWKPKWTEGNAVDDKLKEANKLIEYVALLKLWEGAKKAYEDAQKDKDEEKFAEALLKVNDAIGKLETIIRDDVDESFRKQERGKLIDILPLRFQISDDPITSMLNGAKALKKEILEMAPGYGTSVDYFTDGINKVKLAKEAQTEKRWKQCKNYAREAIKIFKNITKEKKHKEFYDAQKKGDASWWDTIYDYTIGWVTEDKKTVDEYLEIATALKADADLHLSEDYNDLVELWEKAEKALKEAQTDKTWTDVLNEANNVINILKTIRKQDTDAKKALWKERSLFNLMSKIMSIKQEAEDQLKDKTPEGFFEEGETALTNAETKNLKDDNSNSSQLLKEAKKAWKAFHTLQTYDNEDYKKFYNNKKNKKSIDSNLKKATALEIFYTGVVALEEAKKAKPVVGTEKLEELAKSKGKIDLAVKIFNEIKSSKHKTFYNANKKLVNDKSKEATSLQKEIDQSMSPGFKESYKYYQKGITAFKKAKDYKNKKEWQDCFKKAQEATKIFKNITTEEKHKEFYKVNKEDWGDTITKLLGYDPNSVDEYLSAAETLEKKALKNLPEYKDAIDYFKEGLGFLARAKSAKENEDWEICELTSTSAKTIFENIANPKNIKYKKFYEDQKTKEDAWLSKITTTIWGEPLKVDAAITKAEEFRTKAKGHLEEIKKFVTAGNKALTLATKEAKKKKPTWSKCQQQAETAIAQFTELKNEYPEYYNKHEIKKKLEKAQELKDKADDALASAGETVEELLKKGQGALEAATLHETATEWIECQQQANAAMEIFEKIKTKDSKYYNNKKIKALFDKAKKLYDTATEKVNEKPVDELLEEGNKALDKAKEEKKKDSIEGWTACKAKAGEAKTAFETIKAKDSKFYKDNKVKDKLKEATDLETEATQFIASNKIYSQAVKNLTKAKKTIPLKWGECQKLAGAAKAGFQKIIDEKDSVHKIFYDSKTAGMIGFRTNEVDKKLEEAEKLEKDAEANIKYDNANQLYEEAQIPLNKATETATNLTAQKTTAKQYRNDCNTTVKDYETAIKELQEAIDAGPKDEDNFKRTLVDAKLGLSKTLIRRNQKGDLEQAITSIDYIIANDPNNPEIDNIYAYKGIAYIKQFIETNDETKLEDARKVLNDAGKRALALYGLGLIDLMDAGYQRAANRYDDEFIPFDETNLSEAIEKLELSKSMDNTFAPSSANLAIAQVFAQVTTLPHEEDHNEITTLLDDAENIDHNDADTYYGKGILEVDKYHKLMDAQDKENAIRDAEKTLKQALKIDPNHQNAKKELKKIEPLTKSEYQRIKEEVWEKYHQITQLNL